MGQGVRQTASRHLTRDLTDFLKGSGCLGPRGRGKRNPTPPLGGNQEEGGHLTLGPDVPEELRGT
ncbi:hypothetical protein [Oryza sativa Japonica Group]|uniref:Uncharacterized protein n=2 Tax=Oryza sativa subsp. japonica TaxID=39947 RepID=Q5ZEP2_ORYSJ|nr:hypothetical protein [Oryza sativa Japonica Group]BAD61480.1 hypothetical protein [Oryza sativa Japonica Group]